MGIDVIAKAYELRTVTTLSWREIATVCNCSANWLAIRVHETMDKGYNQDRMRQERIKLRGFENVEKISNDGRAKTKKCGY